MSRTTALRANDIVVGRALPYSVYGADKTLLLAKGQIVSERIRDALLRNAVMRSGTEDDAFPATASAEERIEVPEPCPLQALRNHYAKTFGTARLGFRMSRDDRSEAYTAWALGTHEQRGLILSAPVSRDNSLVAVSDGQTWIFRAFYGTAVFRFAGVVRKVAFEPYPYFHLQPPPVIDMRRVRQRPRAQISLQATVRLAAPAEGVIVDLSSCGLRLAMKPGDALEKGQALNLQFVITVLDKVHEIDIAATVVCLYGASDSRHPNVNFYGLTIEPRNDFEHMLLHAYVHERLVDELDATWKILAGANELAATSP
jgi:hypothetical protein